VVGSVNNVHYFSFLDWTPSERRRKSSLPIKGEARGYDRRTRYCTFGWSTRYDLLVKLSFE